MCLGVFELRRCEHACESEKPHTSPPLTPDLSQCAENSCLLACYTVSLGQPDVSEGRSFFRVKDEGTNPFMRKVGKYCKLLISLCGSQCPHLPERKETAAFEVS